jgi:hypothetical protein
MTGVRLNVHNGRLVLTVSPEAVTVCDSCPDMHIELSQHGTAESVRWIAAGFLHLAAHLDDEERAR